MEKQGLSDEELLDAFHKSEDQPFTTFVDNLRAVIAADRARQGSGLEELRAMLQEAVDKLAAPSSEGVSDEAVARDEAWLRSLADQPIAFPSEAEVVFLEDALACARPSPKEAEPSRLQVAAQAVVDWHTELGHDSLAMAELRAALSSEEPVFHLRSYGDVSKDELEQYAKTGTRTPQPTEPALPEPEQFIPDQNRNFVSHVTAYSARTLREVQREAFAHGVAMERARVVELTKDEIRAVCCATFKWPSNAAIPSGNFTLAAAFIAAYEAKRRGGA